MFEIYTVCTERRPQLDLLLASNKTPWPIQILGSGKWRGFRWRMELYANACLHSESPWVVFIDAYDVLMHPQAESKLVDIANTTTADILFGFEKTCYPFNCTQLTSYWDTDKKAKGNYVNAGVMMGKPRAMYEMFISVLEEGYEDDQLGIGWYINETKFPIVQLDTERRLAHNVYWAGHFDIFASYQSAFVHFPGEISKRNFSTSYKLTAMNWTQTYVSFHNEIYIVYSLFALYYLIVFFYMR